MQGLVIQLCNRLPRGRGQRRRGRRVPAAPQAGLRRGAVPPARALPWPKGPHGRLGFALQAAAGPRPPPSPPAPARAGGPGRYVRAPGRRRPILAAPERRGGGQSRLAAMQLPRSSPPPRPGMRADEHGKDKDPKHSCGSAPALVISNHKMAKKIESVKGRPPRATGRQPKSLPRRISSRRGAAKGS